MRDNTSLQDILKNALSAEMTQIDLNIEQVKDLVNKLNELVGRKNPGRPSKDVDPLIIENLKNKKMTYSEASQEAGLCERQLYRKVKKLQKLEDKPNE